MWNENDRVSSEVEWLSSPFHSKFDRSNQHKREGNEEFKYVYITCIPGKLVKF